MNYSKMDVVMDVVIVLGQDVVIVCNTGRCMASLQEIIVSSVLAIAMHKLLPPAGPSRLGFRYILVA